MEKEEEREKRSNGGRKTRKKENIEGRRKNEWKEKEEIMKNE